MADTDSRKISALNSNARSIVPKRDDLYTLIFSCNVNVILLTETWLIWTYSIVKFFPITQTLIFIAMTAQLGAGWCPYQRR